MKRLLSVALVTALALGPLPAMAGPAEDAFLAKLVGSWSGSGALTGAETGTLNCTLAVKSGRKGIAFSGRCKAQDLGAQSFSGIISYNEAERRYEAAGNGEVSIGVKSGSAVTFTSKIRNIAGSGTSVMKVTTSKITIDATVARSKSADKQIVSHTVLTK